MAIMSDPATSILLSAAKALLQKIDNIPTAEFELGGEAKEREALRLAIAAFEWPTGTKIKMPGRDTVYEVERAYLRDADVYLLASYQHAPNQRVGLDQPASTVERIL